MPLPHSAGPWRCGAAGGRLARREGGGGRRVEAQLARHALMLSTWHRGAAQPIGLLAQLGRWPCTADQAIIVAHDCSSRRGCPSSAYFLPAPRRAPCAGPGDAGRQLARTACCGAVWHALARTAAAACGGPHWAVACLPPTRRCYGCCGRVCTPGLGALGAGRPADAGSCWLGPQQQGGVAKSLCTWSARCRPHALTHVARLPGPALASGQVAHASASRSELNNNRQPGLTEACNN
jgi:hypothetical protein